MKISATTMLSEIQSAFQKQFPHLRVEFYRTPHASFEGSSEREKVETEAPVSTISSLKKEVNLEIDGSMKISDFEKQLLEKCGLNAQVYRRSGNLWLQTITTDHWTLDDANRKGGHSRDLYKDRSS